VSYRRFARNNGLIQLQSYEAIGTESTASTSSTVLNSSSVIVNRCSSPPVSVMRSNSISDAPPTVSKNNINNLTKVNHTFNVTAVSSNTLILNSTENGSSDHLCSSVNSDDVMEDVVDDISIEDLVDLESNRVIKDHLTISNSNNSNISPIVNINNSSNLAIHPPKEGLNHVNDSKHKIFRWTSF